MAQLIAVAVFVGRNGIGKWQRIEISIFLQRFVEHDLRVIPVFLADAPPETDLMMFLKLFTWVDFRRQDSAPMELLIQGITRDRTNTNSVPIAEAKRIIAAEIKTKFQVPYLRNVYFTGRSQLLQDLHAELTGTGVAALSQVAAIAGLGGIGKTQTAVEYAYRHFPVDYDWVFWVKAETELSAVTDLAAIGRSLSLAGATLDELAVQVRQWLETHDRWLLIFDNADQPELLKLVLPRRHAGRILLTSRARRFVSVGIRAALEIGKLSLKESIAFLSDRTQRLELDAAELAAVEALARELDGLPLVLEQAGAYLDQMQVRFAVYLAHYRQQRLALLARQMPETGDYPASVATTWVLNFEETGRRSPLAVQILQVSAVWAADDIPEALLQQSQLGLGADELTLAEGLGALANFSLIQRDGGFYSIHRMVQEVVWQGLAVAVRQDWLERAIATLNAMFPNASKIENWQVCGQLVSHVQAIAARLEVNPVDTPEIGFLLNAAGYYLHEQGRYSEAEPLYERSLSIREQQLGADHPTVASSLNNLAELYQSQGRYSEAELLSKRSLSIFEQQLGADHPTIATSLNNLAELYQSQGRYSEAELLSKRSLSIFEQQLGADHPTVATSLNNLALLYYSQGRYSEAELLSKRSLSLKEQQLGADHPTIATSLNNLALLYYSQGRYSEAELLSKRSLSIFEQQLGADHPTVATSLNNLAELYRTQGRYSEAEPLFERSLSIRERQLGAAHPDVALSLHNLAGLYQSQGRYSEAEPLFERSLSIWERQLGADHPDVASSLHNLAGLYESQGRYSEAEPLYERSLSIRERQLGAAHPDVASSLHDLAYLYESQGRYSEAEPLFERSLSILEKVLPANHPNLAIVRGNLERLRSQLESGA